MSSCCWYIYVRLDSMLKEGCIWGDEGCFLQRLITLPNLSVSMEANGYCMSRISLVVARLTE